MNVDNLTRLADLLESPRADGHFYIGSWYGKSQGSPTTRREFPAMRSITTDTVSQFLHTCGTTACIGGWAGMLGAEDGVIDNLWSDEQVREWMGLNSGAHGYDQYYALCYGFGSDDEITAPQAARVIRNLIATGKTDWSILNQEA